MNIQFDAGAATGAMAGDQVEELRKALEAGYGTDVATLTGGGALRIQSLDTTMQAVIQENEHFRLFNRLAKTKPGATVDEWTEQNGIGGTLGGSTNTETGTIGSAQGSYARRVGMVKYLMTRREVSFVATLQNAIADAEATEHQAGALQLLTDAEYLSFEGDSTVVPTEFDGIWSQMRDGVNSGAVDGANIIDMEAQPLNSVHAFSRIAATVAGYGNFGRATDVFFSQMVQSDLDVGLDPAYRVALTDVKGSVELGTPVTGIRTSNGNIATNQDVFVREGDMLKPYELRGPAYAAAAVANDTNKPATVTGATASDASSKFAAGHAGTYYYAVTGQSAKGESTARVSAQITVAAGEKVTLTITAVGGGQETGYVVYRGRKGGSNAVSDLREVARVAKAGPTTTFVDLNRDIPGTTKAYILNMTPGHTAITWRQFLPMVKFPLYPTVSAVVPWAQLLFGYLRMSKRRHHGVIKNILPTSATWKPFG